MLVDHVDKHVQLVLYVIQCHEYLIDHQYENVLMVIVKMNLFDRNHKFVYVVRVHHLQYLNHQMQLQQNVLHHEMVWENLLEEHLDL